MSKPPVSAVEGGSFKVKDTVRNKGRSGARRSETRFYLTADAKQSLAERRSSRTNPRTALGDLLMGGARRVERLGGGKTSKAPRRPKTVVTVPIGTPAGEYFLLACADDRGTVRESKEHDNWDSPTPTARRWASAARRSRSRTARTR